MHLVFTGGIGENSDYIRQNRDQPFKPPYSCLVDHDKNLAARFGTGGEIQADDSQYKIMVIPTNEELSYRSRCSPFSSIKIGKTWHTELCWFPLEPELA